MRSVWPGLKAFVQETVPSPFDDLKMFVALHAVPYLQFHSVKIELFVELAFFPGTIEICSARLSRGIASKRIRGWNEFQCWSKATHLSRSRSPQAEQDIDYGRGHCEC